MKRGLGCRSICYGRQGKNQSGNMCCCIKYPLLMFTHLVLESLVTPPNCSVHIVWLPRCLEQNSCPRNYSSSSSGDSMHASQGCRRRGWSHGGKRVNCSTLHGERRSISVYEWASALLLISRLQQDDHRCDANIADSTAGNKLPLHAFTSQWVSTTDYQGM